MKEITKPNYDDVLKEIETFQAQGGLRIAVQNIGQSVQGRAIPAVTFTDPACSDKDKQRVLVIASQHGSEESGRAMALELMAFLLSKDPQAIAILRQMVVAVIPCVSPDGAILNTYRNANDVDVAHTFKRDFPAGTPEGQALEAFAFAFVPDVFMDIHGMAGGSMKDRVWLIPPLPFGCDAFFLTEITRRMHAAAEAAGFPQVEVIPPGPFRGDQENLVLPGDKITAAYKTLCLGMESIEGYYREADWRADGLARLRALLQVGLEDTFGLGEVGFPVSLVSGSRIFGLKAHGATAAARRENRIALAQFLRKNFAVVDRGSDGPEGCARVTVSSKTIEGVNPDRFAILLRIKKPCQIESIDWEGQRLKPDAKHGYRTWEDGISVFVQANLNTPFGGPPRHLTVKYTSPHLVPEA